MNIDPESRTIKFGDKQIYIPKSPESIEDYVKDFETKNLSKESANKMIEGLEEEIENAPSFEINSEIIDLKIILKALKKYIKD